jgi:hypothetical protein
VDLDPGAHAVGQVRGQRRRIPLHRQVQIADRTLEQEITDGTADEIERDIVVAGETAGGDHGIPMGGREGEEHLSLGEEGRYGLPALSQTVTYS